MLGATGGRRGGPDIALDVWVTKEQEVSRRGWSAVGSIKGRVARPNEAPQPEDE